METKDIEEIVEQYAQSIQDMYFLAGAKISVETWKNTKDFVRNAITTHRPTPDIQQIATAVKERYAECNGSYTPSELYEEVLKALTTLTNKHQEELEKAREEERERIADKLARLQGWLGTVAGSQTDITISEKPSKDVIEVKALHTAIVMKAKEKVAEIQALTPTKTDKTTEV